MHPFTKSLSFLLIGSALLVACAQSGDPQKQPEQAESNQKVAPSALGPSTSSMPAASGDAAYSAVSPDEQRAIDVVKVLLTGFQTNNFDLLYQTGYPFLEYEARIEAERPKVLWDKLKKEYREEQEQAYAGKTLDWLSKLRPYLASTTNSVVMETKRGDDSRIVYVQLTYDSPHSSLKVPEMIRGPRGLVKSALVWFQVTRGFVTGGQFEDDTIELWSTEELRPVLDSDNTRTRYVAELLVERQDEKGSKTLSRLLREDIAKVRGHEDEYKPYYLQELVGQLAALHDPYTIELLVEILWASRVSGMRFGWDENQRHKIIEALWALGPKAGTVLKETFAARESEFREKLRAAGGSNVDHYTAEYIQKMRGVCAGAMLTTLLPGTWQVQSDSNPDDAGKITYRTDGTGVHETATGTNTFKWHSTGNTLDLEFSKGEELEVLDITPERYVMKPSGWASKRYTGIRLNN